jgi:hypothetical protein
MMRAGGGIGGIGTAGSGAARPARRGSGAGGFRVETGSAAAPATAPTAACGVESLLVLQAAPASMRPEAELSARAEVILDGLGALQRGMLGVEGGAERPALQRIAQDLEGLAGAATDPVLAEMLAAVALRAEIELARRGWTGASGGNDKRA